jgi:hypothetical protein
MRWIIGHPMRTWLPILWIMARSFFRIVLSRRVTQDVAEDRLKECAQCSSAIKRTMRSGDGEQIVLLRCAAEYNPVTGRRGGCGCGNGPRGSLNRKVNYQKFVCPLGKFR